MLITWLKNKKKLLSAAALLAALFGFSPGCGAPGYDINSPEGVAAIIEGVNLALTGGDCATALSLIEPLYNSGYSTNEVRLLRASAHGCNSGIQFFSVLSNLLGADLAGPGFWTTMTQLFPSDTSDSRAESTWYATDALQAAIPAGTVVPPSKAINVGTSNPGSLQASHRIADANAYLIFVAMANLGTYQNRYGNPYANYKKRNDLPWALKSAVDEEGCSYAGSVLNLLDAIEETAGASSGSVQTALANISTTFGTAIQTACELGCQGRDWDTTAGADPACAFAAGTCTPCPTALRSRLSCVSDDQARCAAAGIVRFINEEPTNGWQTGP